MSARIRAGLVGAGFIGPWHVDALRRLGNVEVVALAGSRQDSAQAAADKLGIARAYADYQALLDDAVGHRDRANELLQKDPSLMDPAVSDYARLPGGHQEAWADAFGNLMRDIYAAIARWPKDGRIDEPLPPTVATFEDGLRALNIVDAMLVSAAQGGVWTRVGT